MASVGIFLAAGIAVLAGVRARNKNTLNGNRLFGSLRFSDRVILLQLSNRHFQCALSDHNWKELNSLGPCFMTLASQVLQGHSLTSAVKNDENMSPSVKQLLLDNEKELCNAMREIAESYLCRKKRRADRHSSTQVPQVLLTGEKGKVYKPVKFIARGSGGCVFTAVRVKSETKILKILAKKRENKASSSRLRAAVAGQLARQLVLKRIEPSQKNSALNEYCIANKLRDNDKLDCCVTYLDRAVQDEQHLWLLLRRVVSSPWGTDLSEYIKNGFFNTGDSLHQSYSCSIVLHLLKGLEVCEKCNVVMRDVKPDNVLVEELDDHYVARWSDFGLAVDVDNIRSPIEKAGLAEQLVAFWYDTQKLVPKPKWPGRRPPEICFQNPKKVSVCSFDMYMVGVLLASVATGIDIPHIHKTENIKLLSMLLRKELTHNEVLQSRTEDWMKQNPKVFTAQFKTTFGNSFGEQLVWEVGEMLKTDPQQRPLPSEVIHRLQPYLNED